MIFLYPETKWFGIFFVAFSSSQGLISLMAIYILLSHTFQLGDNQIVPISIGTQTENEKNQITQWN